MLRYKNGSIHFRLIGREMLGLRMIKLELQGVFLVPGSCYEKRYGGKMLDARKRGEDKIMQRTRFFFFISTDFLLEPSIWYAVHFMKSKGNKMSEA